MSEPSLIDLTDDKEFMERVLKKSEEMQEEILKKAEEKECVEVEITTREYDHAEAISRATENLCGEEEE